MHTAQSANMKVPPSPNARSIEAFFDENFDRAEARAITGGVDFSGEPVEEADAVTGASKANIDQDGAAQLAAQLIDDEPVRPGTPTI